MIQISFFKKYLYFPQNWAHSVSISNKIFVTSVIFCMLPLTPNALLVIEALLFVFMHLTYNWRQYSKIKQLNLIILYFLLLLVAIVTDHSSLLYICINMHFQLNSRIFMSKWSPVRNILDSENMIYSLRAILPGLSLRSASAIMIYAILHHIVEYSTRYENILLHNSYYINLLVLKTKVVEELKIIIILAYYCIHNNETALIKTVAFIYIKGLNASVTHVNKKISLTILLLYLRILKTINHRLICARIMYTKELSTEYKTKWLLK